MTGGAVARVEHITLAPRGDWATAPYIFRLATDFALTLEFGARDERAVTEELCTVCGIVTTRSEAAFTSVRVCLPCSYRFPGAYAGAPAHLFSGLDAESLASTAGRYLDPLSAAVAGAELALIVEELQALPLPVRSPHAFLSARWDAYRFQRKLKGYRGRVLA